MPFVFDAYGTLLDVESAAREAAQEPGMEALSGIWPILAAGWRERQLRYSWLCSMMQRYDDFWEITKRALEATLEDHNLSHDKKIKARLLALYSALSAYDEVPEVLATLSTRSASMAVLSNAAPAMLKTAISAAGIDNWFDALISVDSLKTYKPTPAVYQLVLDKYGCTAGDVVFFSSNNWDVSGAGAFGFKTVWVNRAGVTWDKLPGQPDHIAGSLHEAYRLLMA